MKVRIKFSKHGAVKFVGHLDMMRFFQKAVRRAGIDIAYSGGFSPHQLMSFASPLSVGSESEGEYLDIEVHSLKDQEQAKERLNQEMVEGVRILDFQLMPDQTKNGMAAVTAAAYFLSPKEGKEFPLPIQELAHQASLFTEEGRKILVQKKSKRKEEILDIRPMIHVFQPQERGGRPGIYMEVAAGSSMNLKPELAAMAFYEHIGQPWSGQELQILRLELFTETKGRLHPLLESIETPI